MIQSLILSFLLGGIIVLTFALVDEKIYQEHQFAFIFLLSTFVLLFESLLVFLDVTLFSNIQLSDLNMLLWPVYLYPYYAIIVFITTKSEFASITYRYKVSALDFIDKNLNEDLFRLKIKECIEYLTTIQIGNDDLTDYFEYDFKDKKIKIPFKDILYIETVGSAYKLNLVGKNFQKEIAGSLSDVLEKDVEERYFSPHQSYIVNRSMIVGMDKKRKQLLLKEGYSCPISRSNIKRVKKLIEEQNLEFSA